VEHYEEVYYGGQVAGRGVLDAKGLDAQARMMAPKFLELLGPLLPEDLSVRCLDLACGFGDWLWFLRSRGYTRIEGLDLDQQQVAVARSVGLPVTVGDCSQWTGEPSAYGLISALDLIEHLDKNDAVRLLERIHDALCEGGVLVLRCPCADGFRGANDICNDLTHRWGATSTTLGQLLRTLGFGKVRLLDPSLPRYPRGWVRALGLHIRHVARWCTFPLLWVLGVRPPLIWHTSQYAVAVKGTNRQAVVHP
jgi:SAM-dependent methyltransferase